MKKALNIISWAFFWIALLAAAIAVFSALGSMVLLFVVIFNVSLIDIFSYFALGYFLSIALILLIYLVVCGYQVVKKRVENRL